MVYSFAQEIVNFIFGLQTLSTLWIKEQLSINLFLEMKLDMKNRNPPEKSNMFIFYSKLKWMYRYNKIKIFMNLQSAIMYVHILFY